MKIFIKLNIRLMILFLSLIVVSYGDEVIKKIHNSLEEIQKLEGKLRLELIQEWSREDELDENKIFYKPRDIAFNKDGDIFVLEANRIKVFTESGKYLRTIGETGRGPGDFFDPDYLEMDNNNNIVVMDSTNQRIQILSQEGEYIEGFPLGLNLIGSPIAISKKNEIILLNRARTTEPTSLWIFFDEKGHIVDERGERKITSSIHVTSRLFSYSFDLDKEDNLYAAAHYRPLLQIYSSTGELLIETTYEVPFEVPEIKMIGSGRMAYVEAERASWGMDIDGLGRIFILALTRIQNSEEKMVGVEQGIMTRAGAFTELKTEINVDPNNADLYQILVFDNSGKIIASRKLNIHANNIRVYNDRLFLIDTYINMRIYEYRISILEKTLID